MTKHIQAIGLLLLSAAACAQTTPPVPNQQPAPDQQPVTTLKVATRVVAISAVVSGKDGKPRGGLTKDDFVLKQDGAEKPIRYFSQGSELPLTIALMVDTSGSQRSFIGDETLASDIFFETMLGRREDRAMLVQFDTGVRQLCAMTSSANALHLGLTGLSSHEAAIGGALLQDAVYAVSKQFLAKETGRKAMVILSDGGDNGSRHSLDEAIEQAQRADVQVYSILYSLWNGVGGLPPGPASLRPPGPDPGLEILRKLSSSTGGRVFTVSRNQSLREIYTDIAQELRLQYELGYTPPGDIQPNSYHKLELKVRDKGLSVQARRGFFAQP